MQKPNAIYEEHSHLVRGFRRCWLLRGTSMPGVRRAVVADELRPAR